MADVFISYKRSERARVERIAQLLRDQKLSVWFDAELEAGRQEGFDAQIEREVTSAHCVVACWTREALRSVYVKAEAKKGLQRDSLVPVFLEPCELPVPFNGVDAIDLGDWDGSKDAPSWIRVLGAVRHRVDVSSADEKRRRAQSRAAYENIAYKVYPSTMALLTSRMAAIDEWDLQSYHEDIEAILSWFGAIAGKEATHHGRGQELAERQYGGMAWQFYNGEEAKKRSAQIKELRAALQAIDATLATSEQRLVPT